MTYPRQLSRIRTRRLGTAARITVCLAAGAAMAGAQTPVGQTTGTSSWPQVVLAAGGRVHVVYAYDTVPETLPQVYVATASGPGAAFSNPVRLAVTEGAAKRPAAAAGPSGNLHVAWAEVDYLLQTSKLRYTRSTDGGQAKNFASPMTIGESGAALNPRVAVDEQETAMLVWESGNSSIFERQIRFGKIRDASMTAPRNLSPSGPFSAPNILYAGGVAHAVWRQVTEGQGSVFYARSTDGGETWSNPTALEGTATTTAPQDDFLPLFEAGPNSIGVLARDATRGSDRILYFHSRDRGASFSSPATVSGVNAPSGVAAGALAPYPGGDGRPAALWVGARGMEAVGLGLHISCALNPAEFTDSRSTLELAGEARELSAAADESGGVHTAIVQTLDRNSKIIYFRGRCPPLLLSQNVVNAGSQQAEGLAPGGLATAYGIDLGSEVGFFAQIDSKTGLVTTQLGPTEITVGGVRAPLLYARRDQVNFQAPVEIAAMSSVKLTVTVNGIASREIELAVRGSGPAFFTLNGSGSGAVVAANATGTFNTQSDAAAAGSVVTLYATGQGVVSPPIATGQVGPAAPPFPVPTQGPTVTIGGRPSEILFGGLAPTFLGVQQLNVRIPTGLPAGAQPIRLQIGAQASREGTTIFVR